MPNQIETTIGEPNGVAIARKETQVKKLGLIATPLDQGLRTLALTCHDLRSLWSGSNLHASRSKVFIVWPPKPSQRKLSDVPYLLLANGIEDSLP